MFSLTANDFSEGSWKKGKVIPCKFHTYRKKKNTRTNHLTRFFIQMRFTFDQLYYPNGIATPARPAANTHPLVRQIQTRISFKRLHDQTEQPPRTI